MNSIGIIASLNVAKAGQRKALREAHSAAEAFHYECERALSLVDEIEDLEREIREARANDDITEATLLKARCERDHRNAVGAAAVALTKMPILWAALINQPNLMTVAK